MASHSKPHLFRGYTSFWLHHPHLSGSSDKVFQFITEKGEQDLSKMVHSREKFQFLSKHTIVCTKMLLFLKTPKNKTTKNLKQNKNETHKDSLMLFTKFKSSILISSQMPDPYEVSQQRIQVRDRFITDETKAVQKQKIY